MVSVGRSYERLDDRGAVGVVPGELRQRLHGFLQAAGRAAQRERYERLDATGLDDRALVCSVAVGELSQRPRGLAGLLLRRAAREEPQEVPVSTQLVKEKRNDDE